MGLIRTKVFQSGNCKAVLLPDEVDFGIGTEVIVENSGNGVRIYSARKGNALERNRELARLLMELPGPPTIEVRDTEEIPEREGL